MTTVWPKKHQGSMSKQSPDDKLQDAGIEVSVLAGLLQHGPDCLLDIEEILTAKDFYWNHNQIIFNILQYLTKDKQVQSFDLPSILTAAKELSLGILKDKDPTTYLDALFDNQVLSQENTQKLSVVLYKLSLARQGIKHLFAAKKGLLEVTGKEDVSEIIEKIEEPVFNFTGQLLTQEQGIQPLCDNFIEALKELAANPQDMVGLPTGNSKWDTAIGGGLRRGTVNIVAARAKIGKSFWCMNVARNVAENGIPVLYLDTELSKAVQMNRLIALVTEVDLENIETGKFSKNDEERKKLWKNKDKIQGLPISHCSIAGHSAENAMSLARRWLTKYVGFNSNGQANPCLLIYDYLKLTDMSVLKNNTQEHQLLGFLISSLHDFAMKWSIPILATVQLNREGAEKDGGQFIAGSDRIVWLGSNITILKKKTPKEFGEDPPSNGTKKLIVTETRYGKGMQAGEYINIIDKLRIGKFQEGKTNTEALNDQFAGNQQE